eukprot:s6825_g3.t1
MAALTGSAGEAGTGTKCCVLVDPPKKEEWEAFMGATRAWDSHLVLGPRPEAASAIRAALGLPNLGP